MLFYPKGVEDEFDGTNISKCVGCEEDPEHLVFGIQVRNKPRKDKYIKWLPIFRV